MTLNRTRQWSSEDVEVGLTYLAMSAGNSGRAANQLVHDGKPAIPARTLYHWRAVTQTERYREIAAQVDQKRRTDTAERIDDLNQQQLDAMQQTLDRYRDALNRGDIPSRDLSRGLRDVATSLGISNQNANLMRGEPTEISRMSNMDELWARLAQLVGEPPPIDSTDTTAIEDATVVGDTPALPDSSEHQPDNGSEGNGSES